MALLHRSRALAPAAGAGHARTCAISVRPVPRAALSAWPIAERSSSLRLPSFVACSQQQESSSAETQQQLNSSAAEPVQQPAAAPAPPAQEQAGPGGAGIAAGAVLAAVAAFAATNLLATGPSLASLEQLAVPLDVALHNGKPTVLEFYADWCEVCKELVPVEYEVQKAYGDKVNFVMLNIDNRKWAQEAADYRVGGIPHFVFLDKDGQPLAAAVGRLPRQVLEGNVSTLASGSKQLPFAAVRERTSALPSAAGVQDALGGPKLSGPRDHA